MYKIIGSDQKVYGPVTAEQLRQWLAEGRVNPSTPDPGRGGKGLETAVIVSRIRHAAGGEPAARSGAPAEREHGGGGAGVRLVVQSLLLLRPCVCGFGHRFLDHRPESPRRRPRPERADAGRDRVGSFPHRRALARPVAAALWLARRLDVLSSSYYMAEVRGGGL